MATLPTRNWNVRGASFALWALAVGSAVFWGLKLSSAGPRIVAPAAAVRPVGAADPVAIARALGSTPAGPAAVAPEPAIASRFQLLGVAAAAFSGQGAAVIAVDGKPGRPFRVGQPVEGEIVLKSVRGRQAVLASRDGSPVATLELPSARADAGRPAPMPFGAPQAQLPDETPVPFQRGAAGAAPPQEDEGSGQGQAPAPGQAAAPRQVPGQAPVPVPVPGQAPPPQATTTQPR
jgi:general secretion pathway protein C